MDTTQIVCVFLLILMANTAHSDERAAYRSPQHTAHIKQNPHVFRFLPPMVTEKICNNKDREVAKDYICRAYNGKLQGKHLVVLFEHNGFARKIYENGELSVGFRNGGGIQAVSVIAQKNADLRKQ